MADNVIPSIPKLDYDPSWSDLFGSAFRTENVVGSIGQRVKNSRMFGDSDPTPVSDEEINAGIDAAGLQPFVGHFTNVETRGDLNNKIAHMSQQARDKARLDAGGWSGFGAQLAAGVMDVPTWLPFGTAVRLGRLGTESLKSTASKLAMMSAADAGVTELGLHATQDLRTGQESAFAVGGSVLLTSVLGTAIAKGLSYRHHTDLSKRMETELPKIADGRAEAEVADQFNQANLNTGRAMRGEALSSHNAPPAKPVVNAGFYDEVDLGGGNVRPGFILYHGSGGRIDKVDTSLTKSLENGEGFFLGDRALGRSFARDLDEGYLHQLFVDTNPDRLVRWDVRASKQGSPAVRAFLDRIGGDGVDRPADQIVKAAAAREGLTPRDFLMANGFDGIIKKSRAGKRAGMRDEYFIYDKDKMTVMDAEPFAGRKEVADQKAAERAGAPPTDPELRQGLPNTRWDGEAQGLLEGPPAGGTGGGGKDPPRLGNGASGPQKALPDPYVAELTPSQMAFAESGGAIAATRGLSRVFGGSPILEMMNSSATSARAWIMHVAELSGRTKGAYEGAVNPIAVQSRLTEYEGMRASMTRHFNDAYKSWRQGLDISGRDYEAFSRNVSQALVRWNLDDVDPAIAKAARSIRDVIETMYGRAVEQGLIRKDAWRPGSPKNPFLDDFAAARRNASNADFDPQDVVDFAIAKLAEPLEKKKSGKGKFAKDEDDINRASLSPEDAALLGKIADDVNTGAIALPGTPSVGFTRESASAPGFMGGRANRLARSGESGDPRGPDYSVNLRFERNSASGELGENLIQRGGLINRRYTDRMAHDRDEFMRAETLAYLQDHDAILRVARRERDEAQRLAREKAAATGEDAEKAAAEANTDPAAKKLMFHEMSKSQKQATLMSGANHAKGSWEFIVHGTMKGGDARVMQYEAATGRSPLHRRNVLLSDEVLLAKGWIDDDALGIANHTVRQIASDVELARVFRRPPENSKEFNEIRAATDKHSTAYWIDGADPTTLPDLGMQIPRRVIGAEFDAARDKLPSTPEFDAARKKIDAERALVLGGNDEAGKQVEGLLDVVTDQIRGTYRVTENSTFGAQVTQALKSYMFAARMGANVITNIGDLGALMLRHGLPDLMHHYSNRAASMVKSLVDPASIAARAAEWDMPAERVGATLAREARAAGIAVETDLMSRMASQFDAFDPMRTAKRRDNAFYQMSDWLARTGSKVYLINAWTNGIRKAAYGIYVDRVVRMAVEPESIAKHERIWLNDLGIDDRMLAGIRQEVVVSKGAVQDGGVWHALTDKWSDDRLRSNFFAAGRKDVNTANVSPSSLEKPLAFFNPILNTMLQFWSFSFGANMRIMGQSAQRVINGTDGFNSDGTRVLLGIGAMVGLGMGTFALHNFASTWRQRQNGTLDPKDELPDFAANPMQWTMQGMARSGVLGVFSQMGDVADNLGVHFPRKALRSLDEDPDATDPIKKYGRPNAVKNLMGPTAGMIDDLVGATRGLAYGTVYQDEDIKRAQVRAIMRNTPFINAFYLKSLTKEAAEYLNDDVFKLPPDRR